jgi:hypothetical protein
MWPFKKKITIEDIETELGNSLLKYLVANNWKVVNEYSDMMFDKGIDYDSYTLKSDTYKIEMDWDNWFEWKVTGTEESIEIITPILTNLKSNT